MLQKYSTMYQKGTKSIDFGQNLFKYGRGLRPLPKEGGGLRPPPSFGSILDQIMNKMLAGGIILEHFGAFRKHFAYLGFCGF